MTYDVNSNARRSALLGDNSRLMGGIAISCISPCMYSLTIVWRPWIQGMIEKDGGMQPRRWSSPPRAPTTTLSADRHKLLRNAFSSLTKTTAVTER